MASVPDQGSPASQSPRPGDPAATGPLASQPAESQPVRPASGPVAAAAEGHDDRLRSRPRWKKILTPIVLALIGVVLFLVAIALYSSPGELPTPPYATVGVVSLRPIGDIIYAAQQVSPSIAMVTIKVDLPGGTANPTAGTEIAKAVFFPPIGIKFQTCSSPCESAPDGMEMSWAKPLILEKNDYAEATYFVKDNDFGLTYNGIDASAAIPEVYYKGPGTPTLQAQYDIPSASSYDWSSFPALYANDIFATWEEPVANGRVPGRAAVGINHAEQASDDNKTFFAGALIGLAGGALLSAVQEALHAND
jgi:hypothetical protein